MNRLIIPLLIVFSLRTVGAFGQTVSENPRYAGFTISLPVTSFNHKPDTQSTNVGLSAAFFYHFRNRFWIEGELSTWAREDVLEDHNYKLRSYAAGGYMDLFKIERINLVPYLGTGLFLLQAGSGTTQSEVIYLYYGYFDWEYVPGIFLGGGLRWQFLDKVGVRFDLRNQIGSKAWAYEPDNRLVRIALSVVIQSPQR